MAVTTEKSSEFTDASAAPQVMLPVNKWHGRIRVRYFKFTQSVAAGDAGSTADLVKMPGGKIRVIGNLSKVYFDAFGAARTLDIGTRAYTGDDGVAVAENATAYASAVDVSGAGNLVMDEAGAAARARLTESRGGFDIFAKVAGGTIPAATVIEGIVAYVAE